MDTLQNFQNYHESAGLVGNSTGEEGKNAMVTSKAHEQQLVQQSTTDERRAWLRQWARGLAQGDPARLPVIREAKVALLNEFNIGLGTDIVTEELRGLRDEMIKVRTPSLAGPAREKMEAIEQILAIMVREGISTVAVDSDGVLLELRRHGKN